MPRPQELGQTGTGNHTGSPTWVEGRPLNIPVTHAFFDTLSVLLEAGVTVVAEAAYQDRL